MIHNLFRSLVLVLLAHQDVAAYFPANQSTYLNVVIPPSLHLNGTSYPHQPSHFGAHYSVFVKEGSMAHPVYYVEEHHDFCNVGNISKKETALWQPPFILMIDRGACTFVTKVRTAQRYGASGVILVDNKDTNTEPVVADDGSGHDISIPSMLISKYDGHKFKDELKKKKKPLVVEMAWHWPKHEKNATIDYWHSPISESAMNFMANFSTIVEKIDDRMDFRPHYHILDGGRLQCEGATEKPDDSCYGLCTNNGRYCAIGHHGIPGKEVVKESLRRMCIAEHYSHKVYWDYVLHFKVNCMDQHTGNFFSETTCVSNAMAVTDIDEKTIEACMTESGGVEKDARNNKLDQALVEILEYGAFEAPTILINELPLRFMPLSPKSVFDVYCTAFEYGKAPHACYQCAACGDPVACVSRNPMVCHPDDGKEKEASHSDSDGSDTPSSSKKVKGRHWGWFFIISFFVGGGGYVYYKKRFEDGGDGFGSYSLADAFMSDNA